MSDQTQRSEFKGPLRLTGRVQEYSWGKVGRASRVFPLSANHSQDAPLAEYWVGSHPKAPSDIALGDGRALPLDQALARFPDELLGEQSVARFGAELPFMLKVLSVNEEHGLSIQLHPTEEQARTLHARDPRNYPDTHHKPELGIALSSVTLLYGCKTAGSIQSIVRALPELEGFLGQSLTQALLAQSNDSPASLRVVREVFSRCFTSSEDSVRESVDCIKDKLAGIPQLASEAEIFGRLVRRYGAADLGLIPALLMNLVVLSPGDGIYIAPTVPHAYLSGDLFECMASSDNVVRAGLTPKFKDVSTLLGIMDCSHEVGGVIKPSREPNGGVSYPTPAQEFKVRVFSASCRGARLSHREVPGVVLCLGRAASLREISSGINLTLTDGGAAFFPPCGEEYEVSCDDASLYYVTPSFT